MKENKKTRQEKIQFNKNLLSNLKEKQKKLENQILNLENRIRNLENSPEPKEPKKKEEKK
jgi:hypothetical protein